MIILPCHWIQTPFNNLVCGLKLLSIAEFDNECSPFLSYAVEINESLLETSLAGLPRFQWLTQNTKGKWSNHHEIINLIHMRIKYRFELASDSLAFKLWVATSTKTKNENTDANNQ